MYFKLFLVSFSINLTTLAIRPDSFYDNKIVGGTSTVIENAPYMAFFMLNNNNTCGGFIVNKKQVVTAAHCVKTVKLDNPKIKVGSTFRNSSTVVFNVAKIIAHPKFDNMTMDYDVAVLTMNGTFEFSETIAPISLADKDFKLPEGAFVKVTGWGATEEVKRPETLREVTVPIVSQKACSEAYASLPINITDNMLCAGLADKDSCNGDSGGPLTYEGKVAGIVSFGKGCAIPEYPGVYARVSALRSWIDTVLDEE